MVVLSDTEGDLNSVDALNLLALIILAVSVTFFRRQLGEEAFWLLGVFAFLLVFVLGTAWLSGRSPVWRVMHDFSAVLLVPVIFNTLGSIIDCASPARWDSTFSDLDAWIFGDFPRLWRDVLGRASWFVDLSSGLYVSYYFVPLILAVAAYRYAHRAEFRLVVFAIALTFYASYVGYFLFPTIGPRLPPAVSPLIGGALSHGVRVFIEFSERTRTDAFPSGHTAVALVCLWFAWHIVPRVFVALLPLVAGIVFSTVYLHYHYVIDVIAGVGLAVACAWLAPRLEALLGPWEVKRRFTLLLGSG